MRLSPYLRQVCALALLSPLLYAARQATVARVAIISKDPFQLQIQTNGTESPNTQIVASPERLVVDIPNALPGPELRGIPIRYGEVRGVRVSLFSAEPPITRIVVDLNEPQWYRVTPNSSGLLVSIGSDAKNSADAQSTIGWVSTRLALKAASTPNVVPEVRSRAMSIKAAPSRKGLSIEFSGGLMTIHSGGASLSEILFQVQKVTGAEIAVPAGTEQDRVAADFGPGPVSEVLGELLNGSGLNFVVVGSEANPNVLRSVILTRKSEVAEAPSGFAQNSMPAAAQNVEPEYQEPVTPPPPDQNILPEQNTGPVQNLPPDQNVQPEQQTPTVAPPPDPPQN
jgi:hypothetical protein